MYGVKTTNYILRDLPPIIPAHVASWCRLPGNTWTAWITVALQTKKHMHFYAIPMRVCPCVYSAIMQVRPLVHIFWVNAQQFLLLGMSWLHSQYKVGGLLVIVFSLWYRQTKSSSFHPGHKHFALLFVYEEPKVLAVRFWMLKSCVYDLIQDRGNISAFYLFALLL